MKQTGFKFNKIMDFDFMCENSSAVYSDSFV